MFAPQNAIPIGLVQWRCKVSCTPHDLVNDYSPQQNKNPAHVTRVFSHRNFPLPNAHILCLQEKVRLAGETTLYPQQKLRYIAQWMMSLRCGLGLVKIWKWLPV